MKLDRKGIGKMDKMKKNVISTFVGILSLSVCFVACNSSTPPVPDKLEKSEWYSSKNDTIEGINTVDFPNGGYHVQAHSRILTFTKNESGIYEAEILESYKTIDASSEQYKIFQKSFLNEFSSPDGYFRKSKYYMVGKGLKPNYDSSNKRNGYALYFSENPKSRSKNDWSWRIEIPKDNWNNEEPMRITINEDYYDNIEETFLRQKESFTPSIQSEFEKLVRLDRNPIERILLNNPNSYAGIWCFKEKLFGDNYIFHTLVFEQGNTANSGRVWFAQASSWLKGYNLAKTGRPGTWSLYVKNGSRHILELSNVAGYKSELLRLELDDPNEPLIGKNENNNDLARNSVGLFSFGGKNFEPVEIPIWSDY